MMNNSDVYIDPEEDEVVFNRLIKRRSEEAENISTSLDFSGSAKNGIDLVESNETILKTESLLNDSCEKLVQGHSCKIQTENLEFINSEVAVGNCKNINQCSVPHYQNTLIEESHHCSSAMKKVNTNILSTPNSVFKADEDGGFLQVLSELALVKAEVEHLKNLENIKEEDKENKNKIVPTILVTEPTPEKSRKLSPVQKINIEPKLFKIIYNSPKSYSKNSTPLKSKSFTLENYQNIIHTHPKKNKISGILLTSDETLHKKKGISLTNLEKIENHSKLISDFAEMLTLQSDKKKKLLLKVSKNNSPIITSNDMEASSLSEDIPTNVSANQTINYQSDYLKNCDIVKKKLNILANNVQLSSHISENVSTTKNQALTEFTDDLNSCFTEKGKNGKLGNETSIHNISGVELLDNVCEIEEDSGKTKEDLKFKNIPNENVSVHPRFSKEAKKVIECIKTSSVEDSFNFTIPEIDVENIEDSFFSTQSNFELDETVIPSESSHSKKVKANEVVIKKPSNSELIKLSKTIEKDQHKPGFSTLKTETPRFFSDRKILDKAKSHPKSCVKKLQICDKQPSFEQSKFKGVSGSNVKRPNIASTSRIPVPGGIGQNKVIKPGTAMTSKLKTPQNLKYRNVVSPINAYIHNKPTSLVLNVKPNVKEGALTKVWKNQTNGSVTKGLGMSSKKTACLPQVEYESGTPYKIEKHPESKLPRLTPNLKKIIGLPSPRIIKHEGRFHMRTPKKVSSNNDSTIVPESEVSVMISKVAQKSNTIC